MEEVSFGFYEQMDRYDMEITEHLVVRNEIAKEQSFTYFVKELDVVIQNDINVGMDVIGDLSVAAFLIWSYMFILL